MTQGDVIRAEAKDIPRIFQVLYAGEGESRKPNDNVTPPVLTEDGKTPGVVLKGHEFVQISFHMPASCDGCTKLLWAPFRPPPAVECKRKPVTPGNFLACSSHQKDAFFPGCRAKFHKEHVTAPASGEGVAPCKVNYDPTTAKEMLLMAASYEEQQIWVGRLLKRIQKSGFKAAGTVDSTGEHWKASLFAAKCPWKELSSSVGPRVSPQESIRSSYKPISAAQKAATLPTNASSVSSGGGSSIKK